MTEPTPPTPETVADKVARMIRGIMRTLGGTTYSVHVQVTVKCETTGKTQTGEVTIPATVDDGGPD